MRTAGVYVQQQTGTPASSPASPGRPAGCSSPPCCEDHHQAPSTGCRPVVAFPFTCTLVPCMPCRRPSRLPLLPRCSVDACTANAFSQSPACMPLPRPSPLARPAPCRQRVGSGPLGLCAARAGRPGHRGAAAGHGGASGAHAVEAAGVMRWLWGGGVGACASPRTEVFLSCVETMPRRRSGCGACTYDASRPGALAWVTVKPCCKCTRGRDPAEPNQPNATALCQ